VVAVSLDLVTGKIQRANLDGTDVEDLVLTGNTNQFGIALDVNDGKIYWINNYNKIQRSNMDGTQVEDFLGTNSAIGIALDVNNEMIYWTEFGDEGKVIRANTDSTNIQPIVTGLSLPVFLALDSTSVPEPITIDIHPDTLNKKSKGKYVTSYIELPETYSVEDIDIETVMLSVGGFSISAELSPTEIGDYNDNDIPDFMVKFNRHSVQDTFEVGVVEMTLTCQNYDGVSFEGSDTVLAIDEGKKH
jgi:hypothetical protein